MERFKSLDFDQFRTMATDPNLSCYEKIGFPDSYRSSYEKNIFDDICSKLPALSDTNKLVLDIGPGCSDLPKMILNLCSLKLHTLLVADSEEMLNHLPAEPFIHKFPGRFPQQTPEIFSSFENKVDVIICYSVFHYIFVEDNLFNFLDKCLSLLAPQGSFLLGDIPNISKRKRFFVSEQGKEFHKAFTGENEDPVVNFNCMESGQIDDAVIFSILMRCRQCGFDAYLLPQNDNLPMANRREDILIRKP